MAIIPLYDIGDKIRVGNHSGTNIDGNVRQAFKDVTGADTDPSTVTLRLRKLPSGTAKVYGWPAPGTDGTLTREALARFYFDYTAISNDDGEWAWRIEGAGSVTTADEGKFRVAPSSF